MARAVNDCWIFLLTLLIKLRSLTNGNLKKENAVNGTNVLSLALKLMANWNFYFLTVGTNR